MKLYDYQIEAVEAINRVLFKKSAALLMGATGCGKTNIAIGLCLKYKNIKTAILMGRDRLVSQTACRFREAIPDGVEVYAAGQGSKSVGRITTISIHSADNLTIKGLQFIIVDEAHNLNEGRYKSFIDRHPGVRVLGITATPWRNSYPIYGEGEFFSSVDYKIDIHSMIKIGQLVPPVTRCLPEAFDVDGVSVRGGDYVLSELTKAINKDGKIEAQIKDALPRLEDRRKIVWTCASIEHAERVGNILSSYNESAIVIHSKVRDPDGSIDAFENGPFRHAVTVMMLTEGIDIKCIDAIVLMRPTKSPTLAIQTIGRGLRAFPGKKDCVILDYGRVIESCGPIDSPYIKTKKENGSREKVIVTVRVCKSCFYAYSIKEVKCPDCGHIEIRDVDETKNLTMRAGQDLLLSDSAPAIGEITFAHIAQHQSRHTNNMCIKINILIVGRIHPVQIYCSNHRSIWEHNKPFIEALSGRAWDNWEECFNSIPKFGAHLKKGWVTWQVKNGFYQLLDLKVDS